MEKGERKKGRERIDRQIERERKQKQERVYEIKRRILAWIVVNDRIGNKIKRFIFY